MFDYVAIQETVFDNVDIVYKSYNDYLVLYIGEYNKWLQERIGIGIPERKAESIKYLIRNTAGDIEEHVVDIYKKVKDEPEEESDVQKETWLKL